MKCSKCSESDIKVVLWPIEDIIDKRTVMTEQVMCKCGKSWFRESAGIEP